MSSVSKVPCGLYKFFKESLFLRKLCKWTHVRITFLAFVGCRRRGFLKMWKKDAIIPNVFSTTLWALDNLKLYVPFSGPFTCTRKWFHHIFFQRKCIITYKNIRCWVFLSWQCFWKWQVQCSIIQFLGWTLVYHYTSIRCPTLTPHTCKQKWM